MRNTEPNEPNEPCEIIKGMLLLLGCHLLAGVFIVFLGFIISSIFGVDTASNVGLVGIMGFLFWQLLYVLPLTIWLKRRGKLSMMKGVIIGAVLTALVNGACYLAIAR